MTELRLSPQARKALCVQIGEVAGKEIADLLLTMVQRIQELERTKVNVTAIAPPHERNLLEQVKSRQAA